MPRLTTAQAAARLGVKTQTLYAYVSRGLLSSRRNDHGASTFDPLEVEALAFARGRAEEGRAASTGSGRPLMVVDSNLTLVAPAGLYYRGRPAVEIARMRFEEAVRYFWDSNTAFTGTAPCPLDPAGRAPANGERLVDRLIGAVLAAAGSDPDRGDASPGKVWSAGERIIRALVGAQGAHAASDCFEGDVGPELWKRLAGQPGQRDEVSLLNAALVLCIDHDLAASTMAARVTASARADVYACIIAALAAMSGLAHGAVSAAAAEVLQKTMLGTLPEHALGEQVALGHGAPGFGHSIYQGGDPRAQYLFALMKRQSRFGQVVRAAERLAAVVHPRLGRRPNVDLALAALAVGAGMPFDAAQGIFVVGRAAGWVAHVAEEYSTAPLRLRPESRYVGRQPS